MKVVVNALGHMGGGGITLLQNLLHQWTDLDRGHTYRVLVKAGVAGPDPLRFEGVQVDPIDLWSRRLPLRFLYEQFVLPRRLKQWDADVLLCTGDLAPLYSPIPVVLKVGNGMPFASTDKHASRAKTVKFRLQKLLTRLSIHRSDAVIYVSDWLRERVEKNTTDNSPNRLTIHPGFERDTFRVPDEEDVDASLRRAMDDTDHRLLSVSTVNPHKNFEVLFRAMARLVHRAGVNLTLTVAGRHPHRAYFDRLLELREHLNLTDRVSFLGRVPYDQVPYLYDRADVFVHPSRIETFGHPFLEAMASDLPIIASRATAIPEVVGEAGLYFDPDDPEGLAGLLYSVLSNESSQRRLIEAGRDRLEAFSWEQSARRILSLMGRTARGGEDA